MSAITIDTRPTIDFLMCNFPEDLLVQLFINKQGERPTVEQARHHLQSLKNEGYTCFPPQEGDLKT